MEFEAKIQIGEYQITTIITGESWCENCYLVRHDPSGEMALVDPGDDADRIIDAVFSGQENLKKILITHAHHDHVGAVSVLHQRFGAPCYLHKSDVRLMRQAHTYALVFSGKQIDPFTASRLCGDDEILTIGNQLIRIMYTPGHTAGSSCYRFKNFIFTGDTLLYRHVGRTDVPGSSIGQLKSSVNRLLDELPEETIIFSGHGRKWNIGEAKIWWQEAAVSPPQYKRFGNI